ncbi:MAG: GAF domain-containing protein [Deinococcales bacterium]
MMRKSKGFGGLYVEGRQFYHMHERHVRLMQSLAHFISIALDKAQQYERLAQSEIPAEAHDRKYA